ncbi:hypothetical protein SAMN04488090_1219 [Siphonobacter aquaeclarae]|uniref:Uncharacterized protein n=1 Tax=Siphonobacter aquaeclarae TaxID=563176 RepID=A0A1G9L2P3_9BACT|nr:hypothetical protein SAMN04488090_1219 [Siphonobacter aquaeclarae]
MFHLPVVATKEGDGLNIVLKVEDVTISCLDNTKVRVEEAMLLAPFSLISTITYFYVLVGEMPGSGNSWPEAVGCKL